MQQSPPPGRTSPNPILVALLTALGVFTIGLIGITVGLRLFRSPAQPTPTPDFGGIILTPVVAAATPTLATPTPSPTEAATATPSPTLIPSPTPSETPSPTLIPSPTPTPLPTPYAGPFRANGGDYVAIQRSGFVIDGSLADWGGVPSVPLTFVQLGAENYTGLEDYGVSGRLAWDGAYLYLAWEVVDDVHVQELGSYEMYKGDDVELWLDADLAGDFNDNSLSGDDYQFGFSAGRSIGFGPEGVVWYPQRRPEWNAQLVVAAQPAAGTSLGNQGFTLEAAIPWTILDQKPLAGMVFGYALNASDNDVPGAAAQQTILMHTPGMVFGQPATFSNIRLQ